jgi:hypothetical protein
MKLKFMAPFAPLLLAACTEQEAPISAAVADAPVQIHFDYLGSCTRLLGNEGRYVVFQIKRIENDTAEIFRFEPGRVRFTDASAQRQTPLLIVPEFSEIEVAARSEHPMQESYLLQYGDAEASELAHTGLAYESSGVSMVPVDARTVEQAIDCDQYAT